MGIGVTAVRDRLVSWADDTTSIGPLFASAADIQISVDSIACFPTLANVPTTTTVPSYGSLQFQAAHLAWQQGPPENPSRSRIIYNPLAVRFPPNNTKPVLARGAYELVSRRLPGCGFAHPSIAADSARVGVAFEMHTYPGTLVALRFQSNRLFTTAVADTMWRQPAYVWGARSWSLWSPIRWYTLPALTQFPSMRRQELVERPDGGLVWQWTSGQQAHIRAYRYGDADISPLPDGRFPTWTLSALLPASCFGNTTMLARGDEDLSFERPSLFGYTSTYYPLVLRNYTNEQSTFFTAERVGATRMVIAPMFQLASRQTALLECPIASPPWIDGGLVIPAVPRVFDGRPVDDGIHPGLPPAFFAESDSLGLSATGTASEVGRVVRTSAFVAGTMPVELRRFARISAAMISWLDTIPGDSGAQADVRMRLELVRTSDSSVIWRGDSISARSLDTAGWDDMVSIPVQQVAGPDDTVFVRMAVDVPTAMDYDLAGCFAFVEDTTGSFMGRRVARPPALPAADTVRTPTLTAWIVPQPALDECTLLVRSARSGEMRAAVFDLLGNQVCPTARVEASAGRTMAIPFDIRPLRIGCYLLRLTTDRAIHTIRMFVHR